MRICKIVLLALNGLRRKPLRLALTAFGVAIASGALISMIGFALGVQENAEAPFKTLGLLDVIQVSPKENQEQANAPILDDDALKRMESLPGVATACPDFRVTGVKITHGEKTETVMVMGLPRQVPILGITEKVFVAGDYFHPGDIHQAILGKRLALELGFERVEDAIGSTVELEAAGLSAEEQDTYTIERKKLTVKVVGVYEVHQLMLGPMMRAVLLPVELIREIPGVQFEHTLDQVKAGRDPAHTGYRRATVRVWRHVDLMPVEKAIKAMGYRTHTLLSELEEMQTFFVFMDVLLAAVGTVALVVAGLGIVNTLLMAVLERQQEIGICKAIGASDGDLMVLFLTEAGIIGLVGGLGGIILGRIASWIMEMGVNAYARSQGVEAYLDVFVFPVWLIAATILFSIVISVLAGVYPALRAARVDPILSLRRE